MTSLGAGAGCGDPSLGQTLLQGSGSRELSPVGPGCAGPSLHSSGDLRAPTLPAQTLLIKALMAIIVLCGRVEMEERWVMC